MVLKTLRKRLSRKHEMSKVIGVVTEMQNVAPKLVNRGCAHCKHVEIRDSWHIQNNRCILRSLILGSIIEKEDGCDRFAEKDG